MPPSPSVIDSHAHLQFDEYAAELDGVLARAREAGVEAIVNVGTDLASSRAAVALADRFPQLYAAVGLHPHEAATFTGEIGAALADKGKFHSIVLRTALPSGAVRDVLIPTLQRASGKRVGVDFGVAVYPAFLRRGTAIQDCINPPAMLLGVTDDETLARVREMEIAVQAPEMVVDLAEAEAMMNTGAVWPEAGAPVGKKSPLLPGFALAAGNLRSC